MELPHGITGKLAEPIEKILFTEQEIQERVKALGEQLTRDYQGKDLLVVCVLKGSLYFTADLIRHINMPLSLDFISVSSYGDATHTSGIARITKDLDEDIEDRHVVITEDILDTGLTLDYLVKLLQLRNPREIKICTLLDKPSKRITGIRADYSGFEIPNLFVVGYGLDYKHKYRHLPFICTFRDEFIPKD
ncbi:MAG: hypoxanthine phosphoribosyltransferase [Firmicutes bacterium]|nr:hypoxanthine phosphoribosyltransferase [Bacillota bacterium]